MPQPLGPTTVAVWELRSAIAAILNAVEVELGEVIDLNADYYWTLESNESFALAKTPGVASGQLSDDLESIRAIGPGQDVVV